MNMRFEGVVRRWDEDRGFGFIVPALGGEEIFLHIKAFRRGTPRPAIGQRVSVEVELGPQGRKRARKAEFVQPARARVRPRRNTPAQWGFATLLAIPVFLLVYLATGVLWRPPAWFALPYLAISALTYMVYVVDKAAAREGRWRTSENALHALSLAGGWPGALLAQQFLRHKSSKREFRAVFWLTVVLNVAAFVILCSPIGRPLWAAS